MRKKKRKEKKKSKEKRTFCTSAGSTCRSWVPSRIALKSALKKKNEKMEKKNEKYEKKKKKNEMKKWQEKKWKSVSWKGKEERKRKNLSQD